MFHRVLIILLWTKDIQATNRPGGKNSLTPIADLFTDPQKDYLDNERRGIADLSGLPSTLWQEINVISGKNKGHAYSKAKWQPFSRYGESKECLGHNADAGPRVGC